MENVLGWKQQSSRCNFVQIHGVESDAGERWGGDCIQQESCWSGVQIQGKPSGGERCICCCLCVCCCWQQESCWGIIGEQIQGVVGIGGERWGGGAICWKQHWSCLIGVQIHGVASKGERRGGGCKQQGSCWTKNKFFFNIF